MGIQTAINVGTSETVTFAAAELVRYLNRMLPGSTASFTLSIGSCTDDASGARARAESAADDVPDTWIVETAATGGSITGNRPRAVLLGVYDYLHSLGCRFLAPGKFNELVPRIQAEALTKNYKKSAAFRHRGVCLEGAVSRENLMEFIDWLPKAGFNSFFLQFRTPWAFLSRWYSHENNPESVAEPFTMGDAERIMSEAEDEIARRGLLLHKVGHGWTGQVLGYPALDWKPVPKACQHKEHPFAAMLRGERKLFLDIPVDTNLCYSNPDAISRFAELVVDYAKADIRVDYLHIWLADEYNNLCECDSCQGQLLSDQYVRLLNEIDARLTAEGLATHIVFLLYQELLWPPATEKLLNKDRFVLMFAPISRSFDHSYRWGQTLPAIPPFIRNHIQLPTGVDGNLAFLRAWQTQFDGDSFIYDYPLGRAHYGDFGYMHIARVIYGDIERLSELDLGGYISCQELRSSLPNALPDYVMGRMLVNLGSDKVLDDCINEYFSAAYGEGWKDVRFLLEGLSDCQVCDWVNGQGSRTDPDTAAKLRHAIALCRKFAPKVQARLDSYYASEMELEPISPGPLSCRTGSKASAQPADRSSYPHSHCATHSVGTWSAPDGADAPTRRFWEKLAFHLDYVQKLAGAMALLAEGHSDEANAAWLDFRDWLCSREPAWQPDVDVYRVLEVTRKYTGFTI